jgi:hypothetical protein
VLIKVLKEVLGKDMSSTGQTNDPVKLGIDDKAKPFEGNFRVADHYV